MKKVISLLFALLICFSAFSAVAVEASNTSGNITVPANASETELFAANTLCERLNTVFGGYSVRQSDTAANGDIFVGGSSSVLEGKKRGSYCIKSENGYTRISGTGTDGLINGVYEFLSEFCGYEVYEKGIIEYTDKSNLVLPENINIVYEPYFEFRKVDTLSVRDSEYCHANSINSTIKFPDAQGGKVEYLSLEGHSLTTQFCSSETYFGSHPEYFALHNGERTPNQLCLTNPDTVAIVKSEVLALLKDRHDPKQNLQIVSVTQNDNLDYCECDNCRAIDEANGSNAGTMITFANEIADAVKAAGYGNVGVDTFAYQYTRNVPSKVIPRDNVIVRLCSIECCFAHPFDCKTCRQNKLFMQDLTGWSKICKNLFVWDYVNNYSETFLPFPNFNVLQKNVQLCYENGVKGYYAEGNYYMNECNGEFYELRSYLISKLMENPYRTDFSSLMDSYLAAVYGKGGKELREYIDATCALAENHRRTDSGRMHIRQQPGDCLPGITLRQIKHFDSLWQKAKEKAENPTRLSRICQSEISWEYWKCCRHVGKYTLLQLPKNYMNSHVELLDTIEKYGNISVGEGAIKKLRKNPARVLFFTPTKWQSKYDNKFFDKLDSFAKWLYELSGEEYRFVY